MRNDSGPLGRPDDQQKMVDQMCDEFEAEWLSNGSPAIETYLERADETIRESLLRELLIAEMELQKRSGTTIDVRRYLRRFPEHQSLVQSVTADEQGFHSTKRLPGDATPPKRFVRTLKTHCPHCRNALEIEVDASLERLFCSACQNRFSLVNDDPRRAPTVSRIGHFELTERLGIGGFGVVWKARDTKLDRFVAIKIPRQGQLQPAETEHFLREARVVAQLTHPNIAQIHEVGNEGGTIYIVTDLIQGATLSDWLKTNFPSAIDTARLVVSIADALQHAHDAGIIHRDLKPQNIMLDDDSRPILLDFGLARRDAEEVTVTQYGDLLGTPAYMSPEQARGEAHSVDGRTDVYSLGAILYQMLTREIPFRGDIRRLIHQVLNEDPPNPRQFNSALPVDLETICLKCLEKSPSRRYASARALSDDLSNFIEGRAILARPVSQLERVWKWACRRPALASAISASALLLLTLIVVGVFYNVRLQDSNERLQSEHRRSVRLYDAGIELGRWTLRRHAADIGNLQGGSAVQESLVDELMKYLERLEADAQGDPELEFDIAEGYARLAAVQGDPSANNLGKNQRSMKSYRKSLAIWQRILARDPEDTMLNLNYASVQGGLGSVHFVLGDIDQAQDNYNQAIQTLRRVRERDPEHSEAKLVLSLMLARLANVCHLKSETGRALELLVESLKHAKDASTDSSQQPEAHNQTVLVHLRLGMLLLELATKENSPGKLLQAKPHFHVVMKELEDGFSLESSLAPDKIQVAKVLLQYGKFLLVTEGAEAALAYKNRALELRREHRRRDPDSSTVNRELSRTINSVAVVYQELGEWEESIELLEESLAISKELLAREPNNVEHLRDLWVDQNDLGTSLLNVSRLDDAESHLRSAYATAVQLDEGAVSERHLRTANSCERLGTLFALRGNAEPLESKKMYSEALQWFSKSDSEFRQVTDGSLDVSQKSAHEVVQRMIQRLESALQE